ncbi:superinfection immunity protein [Acetobacter senegalensis]|uniref:superinfection immunity protein n=1 Tax=Acetobacter senegalensis TaxID=446692 RepID=UPI001ED9C6DA|nr:superinfection immunity protein [Acetobacter senegalensis]
MNYKKIFMAVLVLSVADAIPASADECRGLVTKSFDGPYPAKAGDIIEDLHQQDAKPDGSPLTYGVHGGGIYPADNIKLLNCHIVKHNKISKYDPSYLTILNADEGSPQRLTQEYKPDFDCAKIPPNNGVAVMLCQNSDAAKQELIFDQTYYALRQKVGSEGWKSLKQEVVLSENAMNQQCGLPIPGEPNQEIPDQGSACYIEGMAKLTEQYKKRLSGSALEEANRDIDQHIALQQKLIDLGYLPATASADGVYGEETRRAISTWQRTSGRPSADGFLSDADEFVMLHPSPEVKEQKPAPEIPPAPEATVPHDTQPSPVNTAPEKSALLKLAEKQGVADHIKGISPTVVLLIVLSLISFYFLPTIVSICRKANKTLSVFIVNLLLGWTLIGWIVAIVLALTYETKGEYALRMAAFKKMSDI